MEPLVTLILVTAVAAALGAAGIRPLRPWPTALRIGLAAMFTLTGVVHFVGMREELIAMVPPALPAPELLVTITGVLELAGALGLLIRPTARTAAACLTVLLVVMFPANVYAALDGQVGTFDSIVPRTVIQLVFLAATLTVTFAGRIRPDHAQRRTPSDATRESGQPRQLR